MSFLIASTYLMSSVNGFVSSNRRLQRPLNSLAIPKLRQIALTCPMCGKPFGSGGNRVRICRPNRLDAASSATISRMKSRRGEALDSAGGTDGFDTVVAEKDSER